MSERVNALHAASREGNLEAVKALVLKRPKLDKKDIQFALFCAVSGRQASIVKFLLENGARAETSALKMWGSQSIEIYQLFYDYGWDINERPERHASVIPHHRILCRVVHDEAVVRWFLDHGADPSLNEDGESSPLDCAALKGTPAIITLLLEHGAELENSNALQAAANGEMGIPMMEFLLDRGFNINAADVSKRPPTVRRTIVGTALHVAAMRGHKDRVQFLLERGADPTIRPARGVRNMTPAEWAERFGKLEISEMLRAAASERETTAVGETSTTSTPTARPKTNRVVKSGGKQVKKAPNVGKSDRRTRSQGPV